MPTKRDRAPVMRCYEWDLTLWSTSDTRNRLDAIGRGIYRELLDWCYAQGEVPDDHAAMARYCGSTLEQFEDVWPKIQSHFRKASRKANSLENKVANAHRTQYFSFVNTQRQHGSRAKKKNGVVKPTESETSIGLASETARVASGLASENGSQEEKTREEKTRHENTREERDRPPSGGLIENRWGEFRAACVGTGIDGSGPDWEKAKLEWFVLDFEMQLAAIKGIRDRVREAPDDPSLKSLPQFYLKDRKWQRPIRSSFGAQPEPVIKRVRM